MIANPDASSRISRIEQKCSIAALIREQRVAVNGSIYGEIKRHQRRSFHLDPLVNQPARCRDAFDHAAIWERLRLRWAFRGACCDDFKTGEPRLNHLEER